MVFEDENGVVTVGLKENDYVQIILLNNKKRYLIINKNDEIILKELKN